MMSEAVRAISDAVDSVVGDTGGSKKWFKDRSEPRDEGGDANAASR